MIDVLQFIFDDWKHLLGFALIALILKDWALVQVRLTPQISVTESSSESEK